MIRAAIRARVGAAVWRWIRRHSSATTANRIQALWNVLLGRPTMYRMTVEKGTVLADKGSVIFECSFYTDPDNPDALAVRVVM